MVRKWHQENTTQFYIRKSTPKSHFTLASCPNVPWYFTTFLSGTSEGKWRSENMGSDGFWWKSFCVFFRRVFRGGRREGMRLGRRRVPCFDGDRHSECIYYVYFRHWLPLYSSAAAAPPPILLSRGFLQLLLLFRVIFCFCTSLKSLCFCFRICFNFFLCFFTVSVLQWNSSKRTSTSNLRKMCILFT